MTKFCVKAFFLSNIALAEEDSESMGQPILLAKLRQVEGTSSSGQARQVEGSSVLEMQGSQIQPRKLIIAGRGGGAAGSTSGTCLDDICCC